MIAFLIAKQIKMDNALEQIFFNAQNVKIRWQIYF